jgi:hypothetical protein
MTDGHNNHGKSEAADFLNRRLRINGPEIGKVALTLGELAQIIETYIRRLLEMHFEAFATGSAVYTLEEHAIWERLDKLRKIMMKKDFRHAVKVECIGFGWDSDPLLWRAFISGDEELRRATKLEVQQMQLDPKHEFREAISRNLDAVSFEQLPPEILKRMERPVLTWTEEESGLIQ